MSKPSKMKKNKNFPKNWLSVGQKQPTLSISDENKVHEESDKELENDFESLNIFFLWILFGEDI
jgi:hypothetical protein